MGAHGARRLRPGAPDVGLLISASRSQGRRIHPPRPQNPPRGESALARLSRFVEATYRQGVTDVIRHRGFTGNIALKTARHRQADRDTCARHVALARPSAIFSPATPSRRCARRWTPARHGAVFLGSTASSSEHGGTDALASPGPSTSLLTWRSISGEDPLHARSLSRPASGFPAAPVEPHRDPSHRGARVGSYLPRRVMTNAELSTIVDTSTSGCQRSGIRERNIAAEARRPPIWPCRRPQCARWPPAGCAGHPTDVLAPRPDRPFRPAPRRSRTSSASATGGFAAGCLLRLRLRAPTADKFLRRQPSAPRHGAEDLLANLDWTIAPPGAVRRRAGRVVLEAQGSADGRRRGILHHCARRPHPNALCRAAVLTDGRHLRMEARGLNTRGHDHRLIMQPMRHRTTSSDSTGCCAQANSGITRRVRESE